MINCGYCGIEHRNATEADAMHAAVARARAYLREQVMLSLRPIVVAERRTARKVWDREITPK